ncbi:MAG: Cytidine deaminase [Bacteroidota bacterium]|jgi:cytidine deaminase
MQKITLQSIFDEYNNLGELNEEDQLLMLQAQAAANDAYAPYSRFNVGAAVLLENGVVLKGNNQENASYPIGLCAERVAIFATGANYPGIKIKAIAITAFSRQFDIHKPITPCGACRQAIAEYENRHQSKIKIIMMGEHGKVLVTDTIANFLPYQFKADDLQVKI